jgi:hypothetical protein
VKSKSGRKCSLNISKVALTVLDMPARRDDAVQRHHAHKEDEVTLLEVI